MPVLLTKEEIKPDESKIQKILHAVQAPLYMSAGLVEERVRREQGFAETPYSTILRESAANLLPFIADRKRRTTYDDLVENKWLAFGLNVFGDFSTYVPFAWTAKAARIPLAAAKGTLGATIRATDAVLKEIAPRVPSRLRFSPEIANAYENLRIAVGKAFTPQYEMKRLGGIDLRKMANNYVRDAEKRQRDYVNAIEKQFGDIIIDPTERDRIVGLVERSPLFFGTKEERAAAAKRLVSDPDFARWKTEMKSLTPAGREYYRVTRAIKQDLEKLKIEIAVMNTAWMEGFYTKFGIHHMPHMRARKAYMIQTGEELVDAAEAGVPAARARLETWKMANGEIAGKNWRAAADEIRRWVNSDVRQMPEIFDPSLVKRLEKETSFLQHRVHKGDVDDVSRLLAIDLEMDAKVLLQMEARQVTGLTAAKTHAEALLTWLRTKGVIFETRPSNKAFGESLKAGGFKPDEIRYALNRGLKQLDVSVIPEAKGKFVPRAIAEEIEHIFKMYTNPEYVEGFLKKYARVQNVWKAYTLAIFPAYHSRNVVSNLWNNFLAGMGPESVRHYTQALNLMIKKATGKLSDDEIKLMEEALDDGVLRSGQFAGEIGEEMISKGDKTTLWGWLADPAKNHFIRAGFATGTFMEDQSRLAHYLWARAGGLGRKALSREDAVSSVNKFLFDYKYGITPFEKRMFRDFLAPFYAWTKMNIPLQLEMLVMRPQRFSALPKLMRLADGSLQWTAPDGFGMPEPNEQFMADWMKRALKVKTRYNPQNESYEYFILDQWIPSADINKLVDVPAFRDMIVSLLTPGVKNFVEVLFNYNLYQKKKIQEYAGQRKKVVGVSVFPWFDHVARSIRIINETDKILLAAKNTGQADWAEVFLRQTFGKVYPYSPSAQRGWWVYQHRQGNQGLKRLRNQAEKYKLEREARVLDALIEEQDKELDYWEKIDPAKPE